jgi:hypothetical protein
MRASTWLLVIIILIVGCQLALYRVHHSKYLARQDTERQMNRLVGRLGLTDICLATDARYIRHLSVSDSVAQVMDHPGAVEHFPSSSFVVPVR